MSQYTLLPVTPDDLPTAYQLEYDSYPLDEAASEEKMAWRAKHAGEYFMIYKDTTTGKAIGLIMGTCVKGNKIPKESMSGHDPEGRSLVIHSVVIDKEFRHRGLARSMLRSYLSIVKLMLKVDLVLLLSKPYLFPLYLSVGFVVKRISPIVHGQEHWFELAQEVAEIDSVEQLQVDAFCGDGPFTGNPAAVVFEHKSEKWMQQLANENNLAETAFLSRLDRDQGYCFSLRWFTPNKEVDLCGHATLAAAHALYETERVPKLAHIEFQTLYSGSLFCQGNTDGSLSLNFPSTPPSTELNGAISDRDRATVLEALGVSNDEVLFIGRSKYDVFVELARTAFKAMVAPKSYSAIELLGGRGLVVTALGGRQAPGDDSSVGPLSNIANDQRFDVLTRCFFPLFAINEDPVTGSAHCAVTPYWFQKLNLKIGDSITGYQASPRGGILTLRLLQGDRVELSGKCLTTVKSKVLV